MALRTHARTRNPLSCTPLITFPCLTRTHPQIVPRLASNRGLVCRVHAIFFLSYLCSTTPSPNVPTLEGSNNVVDGPCLPSAVNQCDWHEPTHQTQLGIWLRNCICERLIHCRKTSSPPCQHIGIRHIPARKDHQFSVIIIQTLQPIGGRHRHVLVIVKIIF